MIGRDSIGIDPQVCFLGMILIHQRLLITRSCHPSGRQQIDVDAGPVYYALLRQSSRADATGRKAYVCCRPNTERAFFDDASIHA
jgi:hypothetical protein